jgi:hypothetical protein
VFHVNERKRHVEDSLTSNSNILDSVTLPIKQATFDCISFPRISLSFPISTYCTSFQVPRCGAVDATVAFPVFLAYDKLCRKVAPTTKLSVYLPFHISQLCSAFFESTSSPSSESLESLFPAWSFSKAYHRYPESNGCRTVSRTSLQSRLCLPQHMLSTFLREEFVDFGDIREASHFLKLAALLC